MDALFFDLFAECGFGTPQLPPPAAQPSRTVLRDFLDALTARLKACLPRRMEEPTGPVGLLLDMMLGLFVPRGACRSAIDQLPVQLVGDPCPHHIAMPVHKGDKCAICLAPYECDDVVRHLACTHAFHTECVDVWLERKSLCPICKTDIC